MVEASGLKSGMVIMLEGELHGVTSAGYHAGSGQQGSAVFAKFKNLKTGHIKELRLRPSDKLEEVALDHQEMEYLYTDGGAFYFMNPETFEQISFPAETIGAYQKFLRAGMRIPVQLYEGEPVTIAFPPAVELTIVSTPPGLHEHETSTFKAATLDNGMEVLVPQFIKEGGHGANRGGFRKVSGAGKARDAKIVSPMLRRACRHVQRGVQSRWDGAGSGGTAVSGTCSSL